MLTGEIFKIIKFHQDKSNQCRSIEINPVFVYETKSLHLIAFYALIKIYLYFSDFFSDLSEKVQQLLHLE